MKDKPAFPPNPAHPQEGMTLREYYAGLAMQAMITKITLLRTDDIIRNRPKDVAELSVLYADTLIAELQKEQGGE